jgi:hypothetical protein
MDERSLPRPGRHVHRQRGELLRLRDVAGCCSQLGDRGPQVVVGDAVQLSCLEIQSSTAATWSLVAPVVFLRVFARSAADFSSSHRRVGELVHHLARHDRAPAKPIIAALPTA